MESTCFPFSHIPNLSCCSFPDMTRVSRPECDSPPGGLTEPGKGLTPPGHAGTSMDTPEGRELEGWGVLCVGASWGPLPLLLNRKPMFPNLLPLPPAICLKEVALQFFTGSHRPISLISLQLLLTQVLFCGPGPPSWAGSRDVPSVTLSYPAQKK